MHVPGGHRWWFFGKKQSTIKYFYYNEFECRKKQQISLTNSLGFITQFQNSVPSIHDQPCSIRSYSLTLHNMHIYIQNFIFNWLHVYIHIIIYPPYILKKVLAIDASLNLKIYPIVCVCVFACQASNTESCILDNKLNFK